MLEFRDPWFSLGSQCIKVYTLYYATVVQYEIKEYSVIQIHCYLVMRMPDALLGGQCEAPRCLLGV